MAISRQTALFVAAFFLLAVLGCSASKRPVQRTGFLSDYSELKPDSEKHGALFWSHPSKTLKDYDMVMLDEVVMYYAEDAKKLGVRPNELARLSEDFKNAILNALSDAYPVVTEPGPRVVRIRVAITDAVPTKPLISLFSREGEREPRIGNGGATMEAELLDSVTDERIAAIVAQRTGRKTAGVGDTFSRWSSVEGAFEEWASALRNTFDHRHGKKVYGSLY